MRHLNRFESDSGPVEPLQARTSGQSESEPSGPGILVDVLPPNARIVVTTQNSCYRFIVVDGAERRVQITGGKLFPEPAEMFLEGAPTESGAMKPGWIRVGLPVSLSTGLRRMTTSRVEAIAFERVPEAVHAA